VGREVRGGVGVARGGEKSSLDCRSAGRPAVPCPEVRPVGERRGGVREWERRGRGSEGVTREEASGDREGVARGVEVLRDE